MTDEVYLDESEIEKIYQLDLRNQTRLERVRDTFIIACHTGLRFKDLGWIHSSLIVDNVLRLKQCKTKGNIFLPIHPRVNEILSKYGGDIPPRISNQKYNEYIKEVAKLAEIDNLVVIGSDNGNRAISNALPKYEFVKSHTARRTFCTNAYLDGIDTITIRAISGHKTEKAFLRYIRVDGLGHAQKMLNHWNSKKNIQHG